MWKWLERLLGVAELPEKRSELPIRSGLDPWESIDPASKPIETVEPEEDGFGWDNRQQVEQEYPKSQWEHIPVSSPNHAHQVIFQLTLASNEPIFGEARWYAPGDGVLIVPKNVDEPVDTEFPPLGETKQVGDVITIAIPSQDESTTPELSYDEKVRARAYLKWLQEPYRSADTNWYIAEEELKKDQ